MTFHVGQEVVCVDDRLINHSLSTEEMHGLKKGIIYTIRDVGLISWMTGEPCVRLMEIVRPLANGDNGIEQGYLERRFRPVVERNTDISVFQAMLTGAPNELERADG